MADIQNKKVVEIDETDMLHISAKAHFAVRAMADALFTIGQHDSDPENGIQNLVDQDTDTRINYANMASVIVIKAIGDHIAELKKARKSGETTPSEEEGSGLTSEERA